MTVTIDDIKKAALRIHSFVHETPILTSRSINQITHANLFFKCENFQKIGAFKYRGASNAVSSLTDKEAQNGVATHSSGNHGAAVALAAKTRGIPAYIVMPENSPLVKKQAVQSYGANITYCEPTIEARMTALNNIVASTGAVFIHPYDDERIIAGQGTTALEIFKQCPPLDMLVVPVGGGGLIAGISIVSKAIAPNCQVIGAEPLFANDAYLSFQKKSIVITPEPKTICDGLWTPIGKITFPIILNNVTEIFTAKEETILLAMKYIWQRMKIIVEPSAAITLAVVLEQPDFFRDKTICLLLSGGNVDLSVVAKLMV